MSDPAARRADATGPAARPSAESHSALFAQLVMQQSNMALMLLGRIPDPTSGQMMRDLDSAKLFLDQLEMLEAKTKHNLTPAETALLKQSLLALRLAFFEGSSPPTPGPTQVTAGTK